MKNHVQCMQTKISPLLRPWQDKNEYIKNACAVAPLCFSRTTRKTQAPLLYEMPRSTAWAARITRNRNIRLSRCSASDIPSRASSYIRHSSGFQPVLNIRKFEWTKTHISYCGSENESHVWMRLLCLSPAVPFGCLDIRVPNGRHNQY